ncbi:hypothetical protein [Caballeronia sp. S22]|uniref:hypothetical protein n=1 Tax=Caballeronia sp. S22 TaxID=3137182 RepID=UPI00353065A6
MKLVKSLFIAALAAASPAFASGYGPAPFFRPLVGAPASQRGQSAETIAAERTEAIKAPQAAYGAVPAGHSQSGSRESLTTQRYLFAHH